MLDRDRLLLLLPWCLALLLVGCGQTSVETASESGMPRPQSGPTSLEERILLSDVVARVNLVSAEGRTVADTNGYVAIVEFRFRVLEYLKGSGGGEIVAVVIHGYTSTEAGARDIASDGAAARDTRWDDREAIVFLKNHELGESPRYLIGYHSIFDDGHTVASQHEKNWLPEAATTTSGVSRSTDATEKHFLLDAPSDVGEAGSRSARQVEIAPTITLSSIKTRMAELETEIAAGDGSEAYWRCVNLKYRWLRWTSWATENGRLAAKASTYNLGSGLAIGGLVYEDVKGGILPDKPGTYWLEGGDAHLFKVETTTDPVPVATAPSDDRTTTSVRVSTARPLAAGVYAFISDSVWGGWICRERLTEPEKAVARHTRTVHVTSPPDTLHEAFFDPVAIGDAVGADSSNGVLKPAAFSLNGVNTTISSLKWESGTATMTVSPSASLAGYVVDFIALDGSVTTTLAFDDATQSGGTLTWSVATQPWNDGDLLMLRIAAKPSIAISGLDASIEVGRSDAFTVSASNMATTTSYGIRVTAHDSGIGFDATCADRQQDTTVPAASTSHSAVFTLHACSTTGGTVTATLLQGTTAVATTTQDVTVTAPPPHAPAPAGLSVDSSTESSLSVSWDTVQDIYRYKLERSSTGVAGWSRAVITGGTSHTLSDLSCATTVHFRVSARGDGSPYSTTFGAPSTGSVSGTTGDCTSTTTPVSTPTAPSPPAFASTTYSFAVSENASAFQAVGTVSAVDPDGGTVTHSIVAGNGAGKFEIAGNTGEIIVWGALDYDTTSSYALTVRATDTSGATSTATVNISITDVP